LKCSEKQQVVKTLLKKSAMMISDVKTSTAAETQAFDKPTEE
jgi:hypothetical protein